MLKKKIWLNFLRIIEVFTHKIVTKPSKIWVWDPGSGKNLFRIPDPDPQHCSLVRIRLIWIRIWILMFWTSWIRIHTLIICTDRDMDLDLDPALDPYINKQKN
jgi:hypothetical protein